MADHIEIGFLINDRPRSVAQFAKQIATLDTTTRSIVLDLRGCQYLGPDAAAVLLATVLDARHRVDVQVRLPQEPPTLDAFCHFSGLKRWLAEGPEPMEHSDNVTVPLRQIYAATFSDAEPILSLVRKHIELSTESEEYLRLCVNEVIQNIQDHAESPVGGIICARFIKSEREIRVAIVDRGLGIATTLRRRYPDTVNASLALQRVIAGNYSALSRPNNAGLGVSFLWNAMRHLCGDIFILTEDGLAEHRCNWPDHVRTIEFKFKGTAVCFTLPLEQNGS